MSVGYCHHNHHHHHDHLGDRRLTTVADLLVSMQCVADAMALRNTLNVLLPHPCGHGAGFGHLMVLMWMILVCPLQSPLVRSCACDVAIGPATAA